MQPSEGEYPRWLQGDNTKTKTETKMLYDNNGRLIPASSVVLNIPQSVPAATQQSIEEFLKGGVRSRNNSNPGEEFTLRDLVGKGNRDWVGTPTLALHNAYHGLYGDDYDAVHGESGKSAERILKKVLADDTRCYLLLRKDSNRNVYRELNVPQQ